MNSFAMLRIAEAATSMHFPNPKDFTKMDAKFSLHNMFLDWLMDRKAGWTRVKAGDQIKTHLGKMARALFSLSDDVFDKMYDPKNSGMYRHPWLAQVAPSRLLIPLLLAMLASIHT